MYQVRSCRRLFHILMDFFNSPDDNEHLFKESQSIALHMSLFTSQSLETALLYWVRSDNGTPLPATHTLQSNGHHTPTTLQRHC